MINVETLFEKWNKIFIEFNKEKLKYLQLQVKDTINLE